MDYNDVRMLALGLLVHEMGRHCQSKQGSQGTRSQVGTSPAREAETRERWMTWRGSRTKGVAYVNDDLHISLSALASGYDQLLYPRGLHSSPLDHCSRSLTRPAYPGPKSAVGVPGNEEPITGTTVFQRSTPNTGAGRERPASSNSCSHPPLNDRAYFRVRGATANPYRRHKTATTSDRTAS
jgi:hypothetical protein